MTYRYRFEDLLALLHGHAPAKVDANIAFASSRVVPCGSRTNPVVVPKPTPTPTEPAPKEPVRIPEKVP